MQHRSADISIGAISVGLLYTPPSFSATLTSNASNVWSECDTYSALVGLPTAPRTSADALLLRRQAARLANIAVTDILYDLG